MICRKCGKEIADDSVNCSYCGAPATPNTLDDSYVRRPFYTNPSDYNQEDTAPLTMSNFLVMMLLMFVPIVNIVMLCIWAFSSNTNVNKRNFARAYIIVTFINLVLYAIFLGTMMNIIGKIN